MPPVLVLFSSGTFVSCSGPNESHSVVRFCSVLSSAVAISYCIVSNDWVTVNGELGRMYKEAPIAHLWHYPSICLEGLRKTTITSGLVDDPSESRMQVTIVTA
jgi:hypothetical protein